MILEKVKTITEKVLEEKFYKKQIFIKTFPSFSITNKEFLNSAYHYANQFIKTAFKDSSYAKQNFGMSFDFDDIVYVEQSRLADRPLTYEQAQIASFLDTAFEDWFRGHKNLQFQIILMEGLRLALEERIQYSLTSLMLSRAIYENNKAFEIPKVEYSKNRENMAATIFLFKNIFPKLYEDWSYGLVEPFSSEVERIKDLIETPNINMKKAIYLSDSSLIERFFPLEMNELKDLIFNKNK